jgi:hypothetical protein
MYFLVTFLGQAAGSYSVQSSHRSTGGKFVNCPAEGLEGRNAGIAISLLTQWYRLTGKNPDMLKDEQASQGKDPSQEGDADRDSGYQDEQ